MYINRYTEKKDKTNLHQLPHLRFYVFLLMTRLFRQNLSSDACSESVQAGKCRFWGGLFTRGGCLLLDSFWSGIIFDKGVFHRHLSRCVRDCQRLRHSLIWEGDFAKGASNPGEVVPRALAPGVSGSGCTVPCDLSKRSKCVENIPHVENISICHILYGWNG